MQQNEVVLYFEGKYIGVILQSIVFGMLFKRYLNAV